MTRLWEYQNIIALPKEFLISNSRFLIENFLNQLLCYTDIKVKLPFAARNCGNFEPNKLRRARWSCNSFFTSVWFLKQEQNILKAICWELYFKR